MIRWLPVWILVSALPLLGCGKRDFIQVVPEWRQAVTQWFEEEETLFVFYDVIAEQGIGDPSRVELRYRTDDGLVDWTPIGDFEMVHTHEPVDCGVGSLCGSASIRVPLEPREIEVRLRWHPDGPLDDRAPSSHTVTYAGAPHQSRSFTVYGVFDETNQRIQWRGRHRFDSVRNMRASRLGLRRYFRVEDARYGTPDPEVIRFAHGPYAYGADCSEGFPDAGLPLAETTDRAIFPLYGLPDDANTASVVCAESTVEDALGTFTTPAVARKNPEVRSPFPALQTPTTDATQIRFFLAPCDDPLNARHEEMQRQRLFQGDDVPTTCTDGWREAGFVDGLADTLREAVEAERVNGRDMVLIIGLNRADRDEAGLALALEDALAQILPSERTRTTPRLAGAFVFDSVGRSADDPVVKSSTLWCPATVRQDEIPDVSARSCAILPDPPGIRFGPFSASGLPILPPRDQYLEFVETYSEGTAGQVDSVEYLTPELATTTETVDLGEFGFVTFLNEEAIEAAPDDAFSFCPPEEPLPVFARSALLDDPGVREAVLQACAQEELPAELCQAAQVGLIPIDFLPQWHALAGERRYPIGLFYEFPFLLRMQYRTAGAGAVSAFGLSVPFGLGTPAEGLYGAAVWGELAVEIDPALTLCLRYCDHPTFDSAGVYQPGATFREAYQDACYRPRFPQPADSGFPLDP